MTNTASTEACAFGWIACSKLSRSDSDPYTALNLVDEAVDDLQQSF